MPIPEDHQLTLPFREGEIESVNGSSPSTMNQSALSKLLGSSIRSALITWFLAKPEEKFTAIQLQGIMGFNLVAVGREIRVLKDTGILRSELPGKEKFHSLDPRCPFLEELRGIVLKADGFIREIQDILGHHNEIKFAFIHGSFTTETEPGKEEIGLFVAGDAGLDPDALREEMPAFASSNRKAIDITYLPIGEYQKRRGTKERGLFQILKQPRIWLVGEEGAI